MSLLSKDFNENKNRFKLGRIEILFLVMVLLAIVAAGLFVWQSSKAKETSINSFQECVDAGNPVMESYPEQCAANGQNFTNPNQVVSGDEADVVTEGLVTYHNASQFSDELKAEIKQKITDPIIYYETKIIKTPDFKGLEVDLGTAEDNITKSSDYGYTLGYIYDDNDLSGIGFVFGDNGTISYWVPELCDPGGCNPYPEEFKTAFPETFQAYTDQQTGEKPQ